jgi:hypothetical protein
MKSAPKTLLAAITALTLGLSMAPAALAHGGADDGHGTTDGSLGALLLPPEFVLGGVAFFGVLFAIKRRRG